MGEGNKQRKQQLALPVPHDNITNNINQQIVPVDPKGVETGNQFAALGEGEKVLENDPAGAGEPKEAPPGQVPILREGALMQVSESASVQVVLAASMLASLLAGKQKPGNTSLSADVPLNANAPEFSPAKNKKIQVSSKQWIENSFYKDVERIVTTNQACLDVPSTKLLWSDKVDEDGEEGEIRDALLQDQSLDSMTPSQEREVMFEKQQSEEEVRNHVEQFEVDEGSESVKDSTDSLSTSQQLNATVVQDTDQETSNEDAIVEHILAANIATDSVTVSNELKSDGTPNTKGHKLKDDKTAGTPTADVQLLASGKISSDDERSSGKEIGDAEKQKQRSKGKGKRNSCKSQDIENAGPNNSGNIKETTQVINKYNSKRQHQLTEANTQGKLQVAAPKGNIDMDEESTEQNFMNAARDGYLSPRAMGRPRKGRDTSVPPLGVHTRRSSSRNNLF